MNGPNEEVKYNPLTGINKRSRSEFEKPQQQTSKLNHNHQSEDPNIKKSKPNNITFSNQFFDENNDGNAYDEDLKNPEMKNEQENVQSDVPHISDKAKKLMV
jgi:hypothetical protein